MHLVLVCIHVPGTWYESLQKQIQPQQYRYGLQYRCSSCYCMNRRTSMLFVLYSIPYTTLPLY